MISFCTPWVLHTDKALGLSDCKPKPAWRRKTSFSSAVVKRSSFVGLGGVLLPIEARDQGGIQKKKPCQQWEATLGNRRAHPEGHSQLPKCFCLSADFGWLLEAGIRKGRFLWILKRCRWEWAGVTGIPESPAGADFPLNSNRRRAALWPALLHPWALKPSLPRNQARRDTGTWGARSWKQSPLPTHALPVWS